MLRTITPLALFFASATAGADAAAFDPAGVGEGDAVHCCRKVPGNIRIAAPNPPLADPAFAGHYYLSGVMETGSELLLRPDGSFDWFLSYGAVDQFAKGTWVRDGEAIVLTAAPADQTAPLFTYRETELWSATAEDELMRRQYDAADAKVAAMCPFLAGDAATSAPAAVVGSEPEKRLPTAILRERAQAALAKAQAARSQYEALARIAVLHPATDEAAGPDPDRSKAQAAMGEWLDARWQAIAAARAAGLPQPALPEPVLPAACTLATRRDVSTLASGQWTGGIGVRVFDLASESGARDVHATLHFADGHTTEIVTASRGLALLPGRPETPVVRVSLSAAYARGRDIAVVVPPLSSGIIDFTIDAQQLVEPPFATLRLRIEGRALVPDSLGRGRYERQP